MTLSRWLYFGDFVACPLAILGLLVPALLAHDPTVLGVWIACFVAGCAAWTLVEYGVHRWLYHALPPFDRMHDAHHSRPKDLVGAPSFASIPVALVLFYLPLRFIDTIVAAGFTAGILLGYIGYMLVHHAAHHWNPKPGSLLYRLRLEHMAHHYRGVEGNYGIVTSFWDRIFATRIEPKRRRTP